MGLSVCVCIYKYMFVCVCMRAYIYVNMYRYICMYVFVCSFLSTSLSIYLSGSGNSTTCACLLSTTWPPGRMAIITHHHGDGAIGMSERPRDTEREGGSERRRPAELVDTVSLKHKGDSWRWGGRRGKIRTEGEKEPERDGDSFLCLPHCLPALSLPLSSYLAVLPLTSSRRPLSFFISFVALPPTPSPFFSFCLTGIHLRIITPLFPPPYSFAWYLPLHLPSPLSFNFPPSVLLLILFLHRAHHYQNGCCGNRFIWKWREGNCFPGSLSVHFATTLCVRATAYAPAEVCARRFSVIVCAHARVCMCVTPPFSGALLIHAFHI